MFEIVAIAALIAIPFFCIFSFRVGFRYGQSKEEVVKPIVKPKAPIIDQPEIDKLNKILDNIDSYDGTGKGQKDI